MEMAAEEQGIGVGGKARSLQRAAVLLLVYAAFRFLIGVLRLPDNTPNFLLLIANVLVALGAIGLPIAGIARIAAADPRPWKLLLAAIAGLGLWLGLNAVTPVKPGLILALSASVQDLGKIIAAAGVGLALAGGIREPNILFPAGLFAAFADFVVVFFGTVKHALSTPKGQAMVQAVSAQVPAVHPTLTPLTIGPADFLFLGIFLGCAARFGMGLRKNAWALSLILALSLLLVPFLRAIPALAPMALTFVAVNWRSFRLTRQELIGSLVVLAVTGALFLTYFLVVFPARR